MNFFFNNSTIATSTSYLKYTSETFSIRSFAVCYIIYGKYARAKYVIGTGGFIDTTYENEQSWMKYPIRFLQNTQYDFQKILARNLIL